MKKTQVQLKLLAAGITQNQIADETGITIQTVYQVMVGRSHNQTVQEYVARILNESPEKMWGDSYAPIYRRERKKTKYQDRIIAL